MLEVDLSIERIYSYAAMADKYDGNVHHTIHRNVTSCYARIFWSYGHCLSR